MLLFFLPIIFFIVANYTAQEGLIAQDFLADWIPPVSPIIMVGGGLILVILIYLYKMIDLANESEGSEWAKRLRYSSAFLSGLIFSYSSTALERVIDSESLISVGAKLGLVSCWVITAIATLVSLITILDRRRDYGPIIAVKNIGNFRDDIGKMVTVILTVFLIAAALLNLNTIKNAWEGLKPVETIVHLREVVQPAIMSSGRSAQQVLQGVLDSGHDPLNRHVEKAYPNGWIKLRPDSSFIKLMNDFHNQLSIGFRLSSPRQVAKRIPFSDFGRKLKVGLMFKPSKDSDEVEPTQLSLNDGKADAERQSNGWYIYEFTIAEHNLENIIANWNTMRWFKFVNPEWRP